MCGHRRWTITVQINTCWSPPGLYFRSTILHNVCKWCSCRYNITYTPICRRHIISLYLIVEQLKGAAHVLNHHLYKLDTWSKKWLVKFSAPKTKSILFSRKDIPVAHPLVIRCDSDRRSHNSQTPRTTLQQKGKLVTPHRCHSNKGKHSTKYSTKA